MTPSRAVSLSVALLASAAQPAGPRKTLLDHARETRAARLRGDHRAWLENGLQTLALAPDHPDLLVGIARAHAALGHQREAIDALRRAVERGAGLDVERIPELQKLTPTPELRELSARAQKNLAAVARARLFAVIPDQTAQSEGIAYDPVSRRLFVGTTHGEILQIAQDGKVTGFVPRGSGLLEVLGLKVDVERRLLWAVTASFPNLLATEPPKPEVGVSGIAAYRLDGGQPVEKRWLDERPVLHAFNDLALSRDGTVYVTDSAQGAVYRLRIGSERLELVIRDDGLSFANGIALAPDQKRLYVAHIEGLSLIDLGTGKAERLRVPADASVNSIDGLLYDQGDLIGVQSSPYLSRVIRIVLSPDGRAVARTVTLNAHCPAEYNQTTAALGDGQLYVVAGAPAADSAGKPLAKEPRPQIVRIPLDR